MWLPFYSKAVIGSTLILSLTACTSLVGSGAAICDGTQKARAEHARALLEDGGERSLMSGQVLLSQMDSACP